MPHRASIPIIVFFVTFLVTVGLTLVVSHVWDKEVPFAPVAGVKARMPFPSVAPLVNAPPTDPLETVCVNLVGNASGMYEPSARDPLRPCTSDEDCSDCHVSPVQLNAVLKPTLACVDASAYTGVAAQQSALGNSSTSYCLPQRRACLPPQSPDGLVACTHDAECAACNDVVGDGAAMQCQVVSKPKVISRKDTAGQPLSVSDMKALDSTDVIVVPSGKWCLPRTGECDVDNGLLQWTTAGWTCMCRYPNVHTGETCTLMKACNNYLTTPWSRDKQTLLLNERTSTPETWSSRSGVNPELCHQREEVDRGRWDLVCDDQNPNLVPNVVCRCDGLMLESHLGFRNDPENPLSCVVDNCSVNARGGRTREPLALVNWSNDSTVPPNQCICSGANSRLWDSDPRNPDDVSDPVVADLLRTQDGYIFQGRCNSITLPQSDITITPVPGRAASDLCTTASNSAADVTLLVPGLAQDATGAATISVCSTDPCIGRYSDPNFAVPTSLTDWGHYDAVSGACSCQDPAVNIHSPCDNMINPVCSTCVNACVNMESENPADWPCRQHPLRPCGDKPACTTDSEGNAQCTCPVGCGNTDGKTCAQQFEEGDGCFGYVGVPNICAAEDGGYAECRCHQGQLASGIGVIGTFCDATDTFYAMCTRTTATQLKCRENNMWGVSCAGSNCPSTPGCVGSNCPLAPGCDRFDL